MALKSQYQVAVVNEDIITGSSAIYFTASATTSSVIACEGTAPTGIILPSTWLAATITLKVSKHADPSTLVNMMNFDGTQFGIITVAGAQWIPLAPSMFNSVLYLQLVSSVAQPAMTVDMSLSPIYQGLHN